MKTNSISKSAAIRDRVGHPILDSDGHMVEMLPVFLDYLKSVAGARLSERFGNEVADAVIYGGWRSPAGADYRGARTMRGPWWSCPARNTADLATAMMPHLMRARLDEMGLDMSVVYPTLGLLIVNMADAELRQACARALNRMKADMYQGLTDRLLPVATISMHTPAEAIAELDYAVGQLGIRVVMMAGYVRRPIEAAMRISSEAGRHSYWLDTFGIDSEHDYDPVWAKCAELKVAPTFHSLGYGWGSRTSPSSYLANHLGNFAASAEAICRSLLMGGVPVRFPDLRFAFLEGGVAWARNLYCDLIAHWHKRNREAMENYNPDSIDGALFERLAAAHGGRMAQGRAGEIVAAHVRWMKRSAAPDAVDEWAQSGIRSPEDIRDLFTGRFYFGCEGDDPMNALAFDTRGAPFGSRLGAFYGSDIGHWDVPDMKDSAEEAYELVEQGLITHEDLRAFVFENPVRFWTAVNPGFFEGTILEGAAASLAR